MCEAFPYQNHHDIYFRDRVPKGKSKISCEIEDREFAFGLLENIKLDTPEVRNPARSLWSYGLYDPYSLGRERFRGQGQFPNCSGMQDHSAFNL